MDFDEAKAKGLIGAAVTFVWDKPMRGLALQQYCTTMLNDMLARGKDFCGLIAGPDKNNCDNIWVYFKQFVLDETNGKMRVVDVAQSDMCESAWVEFKQRHWHVVRLELVKKQEVVP